MFEMEAGQVEIDGFVSTMVMSSGNGNPAIPPSQMEHSVGVRVDPAQVRKKTVNVNNQVSQDNNSPPSVSSCYVFKSRLQEYAQRAGLTTPVYETIKEGPSHEPSFRSTVIMNNVRYNSLPGFFNRKASEQSAAEVALVELSNSVDTKFGISAPVHETGLCKNLLQEYAQKMNYAIPLYQCHKEEKPGRVTRYSCTVEIGSIKYIGTSASTKKEAEIKAARTALLAIQSAPTVSEDPSNNSIYTVIPPKKETSAALKPKKGRFKRLQKWQKLRARKRGGQGAIGGGSEVNMDGQVVVELGGGSEVNMDGQVGMESGGGSEVNMDGRAGVETGVSEAVGSQHNMADGSGVNMDGESVKESSATNVVGTQGTDNGVGNV